MGNPYYGVCLYCNVAFTRVDKQKKFCSKHCREQFRHKTNYHPTSPRVLACAICGSSFEAKQGRKVYCSAECKRIATNISKRKPATLSRGEWLIIQVCTIGDSDSCLSWPYGRDRYGYPCSILVGGVQLKPIHASLILSGQPRPAPPKHHALHSCHNPSCVNPNHLRWGSHKDNMRDKWG